MDNVLNSVEDIDTMLENEFNLTNSGADSEETEGSVGQDTEIDVDEVANSNENDLNEEDDQTDEESSEDTAEQNEGNALKSNDGVTKHSKEEKEEYAFAQLRKENASLKATLKEKSSSDEMLKKIAAQYGYDDVNKFTKDYEDARIIEEAKTKGYDPVLYKELQESKRRIEELERTNEQASLMAKASAFRNALDKVSNDFNLGEDEKQEVFTKLESAGYTVDTILSLPNPEFVIKGVLADRIAEISKQKQLEKLETLDNLADDKYNSGQNTKTVSLDDLINQEIKEYKAKNFYN